MPVGVSIGHWIQKRIEPAAPIQQLPGFPFILRQTQNRWPSQRPRRRQQGRQGIRPQGRIIVQQQQKFTLRPSRHPIIGHAKTDILLALDQHYLRIMLTNKSHRFITGRIIVDDNFHWKMTILIQYRIKAGR